MAARLWVVATPIGNLGDLSPRAAETLRSAPLWIVEDTRVSSTLARHLEVAPTFKLLNDHTPPHRIPALVAEIERAETAVLLTDAGTPGLSDPGANLVDACATADLEIEPIPGPSAVTTALSISGFYAQRFAFLGFLPRKPGDAAKVLAPFTESTLTLTLFESPHRIRKTLEVCAATLGDRRVVICRELTKKHQQIYRDSLNNAISGTFVDKGEFTVVIEGLRRLNQG